jgi:putative membrane protein
MLEADQGLVPFAYQAHLRMAIWLYLFFLPVSRNTYTRQSGHILIRSGSQFQIYSALKWITIPATLFAAFLFLGFLEIGAEM